MVLVLYFLIAIIVPYFMGAIPVGAVIAAVNHVDISTAGSGKIGATNVLRSVGRRAATLVLLGDVLKGALAVFLVRLVEPAFAGGQEQLALFGFSLSILTVASLLASAAVVSGHVWSIYLRLVYGRWHGGRGVATAIGALAVVNPWVILVAAVVGVSVILVSRYVSLGSIIGSATGALMVVLFVALGQMDILSLLFICLAVFIIAAHRDNIERLMKGTERKIGEHAKST